MQRTGLILANRAYLDHETPRSAGSSPSGGNGGLLATLRPVIEPWDGTSGTTWIGAGLGQFDSEWTDARGFELIETPRGTLRHRRLFFPSATWQGHYAEVSNSFLWPLVHLVRNDLPAATSYYPAPAVPSADDWEAFVAVNSAFAAAAAEETDADWCWVHDYQLALTPGFLRERRFAGKIGFFLHTPFPNVEVARPYLAGSAGSAFKQVVAGMLGADLLGFQTNGDVERFQRAALAFCGAELMEGAVAFEGHIVRTVCFPVGIDIEDMLEIANTAPTPPQAANAKLEGLPLVVGLERADYTKGIPERLRAIAEASRSGCRFAYLGIAAPTREGVRAYDALESAIEAAANEARQACMAAGGSFAHVRANVEWEDVVALQRVADVVFTSSLADGQNLVPLQAAIAQSLRPAPERAVILTGRDAGVASTFGAFSEQGLFAVEPLDHDALTHALIAALDGRPGRVSDRFVQEVRLNDAFAWSSSFLAALEEEC